MGEGFLHGKREANGISVDYTEHVRCSAGKNLRRAPRKVSIRGLTQRIVKLAWRACLAEKNNFSPPTRLRKDNRSVAHTAQSVLPRRSVWPVSPPRWRSRVAC